MNYRTQVSLIFLMSSILPIHCANAEQSASQSPGQSGEDLLTFFDYLGTLVESEEGWIDPLDLVETNEATISKEPVEPLHRDQQINQEAVE